VYLGLALSRLSDICNALCRWEVTKTQVRNLYSRQAIPMLWDFIAERKKRAADALQYNGLAGSWAEIRRLADAEAPAEQAELL